MLVRKAHSRLNTGHREVVDADLSGSFDSIPHSDRIKSLARRIRDRHRRHLLEMWLPMPVEEEDGRAVPMGRPWSLDSSRAASGRSFSSFGVRSCVHSPLRAVELTREPRS